MYIEFFNDASNFVRRCREAKKTLPKPKVGDYCTIAMEQGFSDACVALCMDQQPQSRVAQTCRAASMEMPRPTVRKFCEHGYMTAFDKTVKELKNHFVAPPQPEEATGVINEESSQSQEQDTRHVVNTIPITLDDVMRNLEIHEVGFAQVTMSVRTH